MSSFRDIARAGSGQPPKPSDQQDQNVGNNTPGQAKPEQKKKSFKEKMKDSQSKPLPKFTIGPDKSLSLSFEIMNQGMAYKNAKEVINAETMKLLLPLIRPLCKLANAAVHQSISAMKSPGYAKMRDANGKLTKQLELDKDGKPIPIPSALDVAKNAYNELLKDPKVKSLLDQLSTYVDSLNQRDQDKPSEGYTYDPNQGPGK